MSLAEYCDEFLVHAVDVEGKLCGIQEELVELLACYSPIPVTYAGGARSLVRRPFVIEHTFDSFIERYGAGRSCRNGQGILSAICIEAFFSTMV